MLFGTDQSYQQRDIFFLYLFLEKKFLKNLDMEQRLAAWIEMSVGSVSALFACVCVEGIFGWGVSKGSLISWLY